MTDPGDSSTDPAIRMRPHHVLCSIGFAGEGYSDSFTANMAAIVLGRLRAPRGDEQVVEIVSEADAICAPCPHRVGSGCMKNDRIEQLDLRHGTALDLAPGQKLRWGDAVDRVRGRVAPDDLDRICQGCQWLPLGLCKSAVAALSDKAPSRG